MRNACKEEVWHRILSINFSIFLHELKKNLNNDLVNFFILGLEFFHLFFINFHYIQCLHIFVTAKEYVTKRKLMNFIVNFVLEFFHKFLIIILFLNTLLLMNVIFLKV